MEAVLFVYQTTRCHMPEVHNPDGHCHANLKSHIFGIIFDVFDLVCKSNIRP
jgi:hypothetical protein